MFVQVDLLTTHGWFVTRPRAVQWASETRTFLERGGDSDASCKPDRVVTMTFHHPEDVHAPNRFRIARSDQNDTLVRANDGDPETIEAVAADFAHVFARQAMRR